VILEEKISSFGGDSLSRFEKKITQEVSNPECLKK
jgi:hypothetical protein